MDLVFCQALMAPVFDGKGVVHFLNVVLCTNPK